ncbi:hypothetical protein [Alcaligenes faecalis]|uniref:hypothetical protein n=1 Tax=Alcaligenes faecalis TaxID=511 RepID=UPI000A3209C4|nr:hypothetical protein [Alcaligenes faecalis]
MAQVPTMAAEAAGEENDQKLKAVSPAEVTSKKQEERGPLSIPLYRQTLELSSLQAHRVMDRSFAATSRALFRIDVLLRIIGQEDSIDEVEEMIRNMIKELQDDIKKEISGADQLLKENGITKLPEYTNPHKFEIEIRSPQIANFSRLVTSLDTLILRIDALWINGLMPNKQRARVTHQWQQRLIGLAGRLIGYEKRARVAARNAGKEAEMESLAPTSEHVEDEQALAAEQQELAKESK